MHLLVLSAILTGCGTENQISGKDGAAAGFDSGGGVDVPVDTDSEPEDSDSGEVVVTGDECGSWNGDAAASTLPLLQECEGTPSISPAWELVDLWSTKEGNTMGAGLTSVANLTDDNGDGKVGDGDTPDVVFTAWYGNVLAFDGATGETIWEAETNGTEQGIPAIGDLDGDGFPEVVVSSLMWLKAFNGQDGSEIWSGRGPTGSKTECGGPGIADLDGDGAPEVFHGRQIFDGLSGDTLGEGKYGHGSGVIGESPSSIAADIDLDGVQEVLVGNAAYTIDGDTLFYTGAMDGFPAVANFDDDPEGELVSVAAGAVHLYDSDGSEIWSVSVPTNYPSAPAVADFDGDGLPEIVFHQNGDVMMLDTDGTEMWTAKGTKVTWVAEMTAADLDNDGTFEVLSGNQDGLTVYNGADGAVLAEYTMKGGMCGTNAIFADVDGDGRGEIMVSGSDVGVVALTDADGPLGSARPTWNEGGYNITNIEDDTTVPALPEMNWAAGYNSFRAAPPAEGIGPAVNVVPDLVDICAADCATGSILVSWRLGNDGASTLTDDVPVEIWGATDAGEQLLWSGTWEDDVASGVMAASITTVISGLDGPLYDLWLVADGLGGTDECDEADNRVVWGAQVCN